MNKEIIIKKVFLRTFGCQMNVRDSEVICGLLKNAGFEIVQEAEDPDIVLFNTCSVRQHAEDKVWSEIGRYCKPKSNRRKPMVGLLGCMAQNYKEKAFERSEFVDFVVGPSDIDKIPTIIKDLYSVSQQPSPKALFQRKIWETDGEARPEVIYHSGFYEDENHAFVVISEGCSNFCTYCVVPYVRGAIRHRAPQNIIREIEEAIAAGKESITLLGQNVNAYQYEDVNFVKLVEFVNAVKGLKEFSFITSHPKDTSLELFHVIAGMEKLKKSLHLPVQAGSDRILKSMNRGYSRKFYLDLADNYRKIVKGASLTTDIIVGFPTETPDEFQDTYDLVKRVEFNAAYIFKYSPRPHTEAAHMLDDVAQKEKEWRHKLVLDLQKEISKKIRKSKE
ncbi:MAG: tRNA (N6-isopentenyl adenosine(37)-C2)-methylthiotransferase MiaB [Candidatus Omnitrophota bacterium]|jgi:tRNA-2-methylthio-N6-dimethylallyladenosine synthase